MLNEVVKVSPPNRILYPVVEAGILLGVAKTRAWELVASGELPTRWNGGRRVVHIDDIRAFADNCPTEKPDFATEEVAA